MIHGALELLQKWNTLIYTRYRSNYKKKKYKYTNLWKVNSPNKTDCVSLLIYIPNWTYTRREDQKKLELT